MPSANSKPDSGNPLRALLESGLHVSSDGLDAKSLVTLVDRRWRVVKAEASERIDSALADGKRASLASIAELAQRLQLQGAGAFKLRPDGSSVPREQFEQFSSSLRAAAASMRRSASDSTLGRTLARSLSGKELALWGGQGGAGSTQEFALFKSLDANLRNLERSFREGTAKQSKAAAKRRARTAAGGEEVRVATR